MYGFVEYVNAQSEFKVSGEMTTYFCDHELLARLLEDARDLESATAAPATETAVARFL
jgi:hypothetical protein